MKTNKSYAKRLKVTKNGKIISRGTGQNHFNAKESRRIQMRKKRMNNNAMSTMSNKSKARFLINLK